MGDTEIIDFTYVNVSETDADEVDILIEGGDTVCQPGEQRGDVLTILLSGVQQNENETLVVRLILMVQDYDEARKRSLYEWFLCCLLFFP